MVSYAFALVATAAPFLKPVLRPLDTSGMTPNWNGTACLQSSESTCGPASATTILHLLGDTQATEKDIARRAWTSASGTEAWHLARVLRARHRTVTFEFSGLPAPDHLPGILGVKTAGCGHFVALLSSDGDNWTIADPLEGEAILTRQDLERRFQITPFFMGIR